MPDSPIVQTAVKEAIAHVVAVEKAVQQSEKKTVEQFIDLGKALWDLKGKCAHGEWLKALEKTGIQTQRASEAMRAAKFPRSGNFSGMLELRNALAPKGDETDEIEADREPGVEAEPEEESPAEEPKPAKADKKICDRCRRVGVAKDCAACEVLRKPNRKPESKTTISSNRAGKPLFDWKRFEEKLRPIAQSPDELARAYPSEKNSAEYKRAQSALNEYIKAMEDWKKRLKGKS